MSVFFELSGIKEALESFREMSLSQADKMEITRYARLGLVQVKKNIQADPVWKNRSGRLSRSHYTDIVKEFTLEIGASAPHAKHLYYGTKRHFVKPKSGGKLRWTEGGFTRYSKGHWVSGVWAGKKRTGRESGTRSTPKSAKELRWIEKEVKKKKSMDLISEAIAKRTRVIIERKI